MIKILDTFEVSYFGNQRMLSLSRSTASSPFVPRSFPEKVLPAEIKRNSLILPHLLELIGNRAFVTTAAVSSEG